MTSAGRRAVFLDRDGVLNEVVLRDGRPASPPGLPDVRIPPGVAEALRRLRQAGFVLICVTNQPEVARGRQRRGTVEAINRALGAALPIDDFFVCYHDDEDDCQCRKPRPGLLLAAAARHGLDLRRSVMVGDRWRDVDAGHRAGCLAIQIAGTHVERAPDSPPEYATSSLSDAASWILERASHDLIPSDG